MKKALLAGLCLVFSFCLQAQTYTSGHLTVTVTDSMHHDSTNCSTGYWVYYNVSIDSSYTGQVVNLVDTFSGILYGTFVNTTGISPWSFTTGSGGGSIGSSSVGGVHDFHIVGGYARSYPVFRKITAGLDTVFSTTSDSLLVTDPCAYSTVSGHTFIDNNANCIYDAGDNMLYIHAPELNIYETHSFPGGGWNQLTSLTHAGALYTLGAQQSWMATCTVAIPSYYYFVFSSGACFAGPHVFTSLPATGADFPFQCTSNIDVQCGALSPMTVRLHSPFLIHPYVSNTGCATASGQLTLIKDARTIYDAGLSSHPADIVSGDTLVWNYSGLTNVGVGGYWNSLIAGIHLEPDTSVGIGDTLCFRTYTNIPTADINVFNNDYSFCVPVVYSFDPNMKEVSPEGTGPEGYIQASDDTLTYTLHFQNTGTAVAHDVRITDTLDSHINAASLKILGTSHNMIPEWLASNVVQFRFNNINLADSNSNEPASHGSIRFSVALNTGLPIGTRIKNTGYIYFDLNPPVVTNTVLNTIAEPSSVGNVKTNAGISVYPNPATDHIVVENLGGGDVLILNLSGIAMVRRHIADNKATIDLKGLPPGLYVLKTVTNSETTTTRFVKY